MGIGVLVREADNELFATDWFSSVVSTAVGDFFPIFSQPRNGKRAIKNNEIARLRALSLNMISSPCNLRISE
jgi:hypothetical protein